jgi:ubiquinol-cytochrome c reductase iron-sulfur subunit
MSAEKEDAPEPRQGEREDATGASTWLALSSLLAWRVGKSAIRAALRWLPVASSKESGETEKREKDRNLIPGPEAVLVRRKRWGTFLIACSFAASFAGGVGMLVAYWTGGSNQFLGGSLALFLFGWGVGFTFWAHWLTAQKEAVDPREPLDSPEDERDAVRKDFCSGELHRRTLLKIMCGCGLGFAVAFFISLVRSLGFNPDNALYSGVWKRGQRLMTEDGKAVTADFLARGSMVIVFPEESLGAEKAQTVLVRVDPELLRLPADRADWAPMGNIAFSRVCTHAGCTVGMYERTVNLLMCPCHQSTFDVLAAAQPTGGPAARPLPQLPIYVDSEGVLRAGGDFSEPPGPGFWGMPS